MHDDVLNEDMKNKIREILIEGGDFNHPGWWHEESAYGVVINGCCRDDRARKRWAILFGLWKFIFFVTMNVSFWWGFHNCWHFGRLFYFTTWQVLSVYLYSFLSLVDVILIRCCPIGPDDKLEFSKRTGCVNHFTKVTWISHSLAFCYTIWVFALFNIGTIHKYDASFDSIIVHVVPTFLMILDFCFSGVRWPISLMLTTPIYGLMYMTWSAIHYRFQLGRFTSFSGTCAERFQASFTTNTAHYVYEEYNWANETTAMMTTFAVLVLIPAFTILVWMLSKIVLYSIRTRTE